MPIIKVRAWNTQKHCWSGLNLVHTGPTTYELKTDPPDCRQASYVITMLYTGVYDKNGKEIYEKDIVRKRAFGIEKIGTVEWIEELLMFVIAGVDGGYYSLSSDGLSSELEVLGNVFENPEILSFPPLI